MTNRFATWLYLYSGHEGTSFHLRKGSLPKIVDYRKEEVHSHSLCVLLEIFVRWIRQRFSPVNEKKIRVLHPCVGVAVFHCAQSENNSDAKSVKEIQQFGTFRGSGFDSDARDGLTSLSVIGDNQELNFCRWIEKVLKGEIDTDEVVSFVEEVGNFLDAMEVPWKDGYDADDGGDEWNGFTQTGRHKVAKKKTATSDGPLPAKCLENVVEIVKAPMLFRELVPDSSFHETLTFLEKKKIVTGYVVDQQALNDLMKEHETKPEETEKFPLGIQRLLEFPNEVEKKHAEKESDARRWEHENRQTPRKGKKGGNESGTKRKSDGTTPVKYLRQLKKGTNGGRLLWNLETMGYDWSTTTGRLQPHQLNINEREQNGQLTPNAKDTRIQVCNMIEKRKGVEKRAKIHHSTEDASTSEKKKDGPA